MAKDMKNIMSELVKMAYEKETEPKSLSITVPIQRDVLVKALQQEYFNKGEASNFLGVSLTTFKRWSKEYKILAFSIDGIIMYSRKDLISFMENKKLRVKGVN